MADDVSHPYLDGPRPLPFVHRGGAGESAENTTEAFQVAWDLGFRWFETDVRASRDAVLIATHDATLDRTTNLSGRIARLRWSELATARSAGGEALVRLEQLLSDFPEARFNLDVKAGNAVFPLVQLLWRRRELLDRVCVTSFSARRLDAVRRLVGDGLCSGASASEVLALRATSRLGRTSRLAEVAQVVQVPARGGGVTFAEPSFLRAAHEIGLPVHVWTVDDPQTMERLLDLGVDGIMTDRPTMLRDVLQRRGVWATSA